MSCCRGCLNGEQGLHQRDIGTERQSALWAGATQLTYFTKLQLPSQSHCMSKECMHTIIEIADQEIKFFINAGEDETWEAFDLCHHSGLKQRQGYGGVWASWQPSQQHSHLQPRLPACPAKALRQSGASMHLPPKVPTMTQILSSSQCSCSLLQPQGFTSEASPALTGNL